MKGIVRIIVPIPSGPVLDEGEETSVSVEQRIDSNVAQTRVGDRAGWPAAKHILILSTFMGILFDGGAKVILNNTY